MSAEWPTSLVEPGEVQVRRALLSVSDKRGLVDFAKGLADMGVEIVSTGGTAKALAEAGVETRAVEDYTGFPEVMDGRVKTLNPKIYAGLLAVRSNPEHVRGAARAGHRADRPGVREPLPVRARGRRPRRDRRGGHREHRHRRPHAHPRGRQEPPVRRGGHLARELRRGARGDAPLRRSARGAHARVAGAGGVLLHGALRRGDLALVRRARGRLPGAGQPLVHQGAGPLLRREPPPARGVLHGVRRPDAPAVDGLQDPRQGAVVQQPAGPGRRPEAGRRVRAAGRGDHQAQQPVRGGGGQHRARGVRARAGHRQPERLRRRHVLQPRGRPASWPRP